MLCPDNRAAGHRRCVWHVLSLTCTLLLPLSWTVSLWAEPIKTGTSAPHGSLCSTEPAAYPRDLPRSHTLTMRSIEKARIYSVSKPLVCASRSHGERHTSYSVPAKWLEAENCTRPDPFRLDLSLINKQFSSRR